MNMTTQIYAGILRLDRTYGRTENGKRLLYRCIPDSPDTSDILVPYQIANSFEKSHKNKYILYKIVSDDKATSLMRGEIVETLGDVDSPEAFNEYQVCRKRLNIPLGPFTEVAKRRLKGDDEWPLIEKMLDGDKIADLRNYNVITIDPDSCTDFDDAFSAHIIGNTVMVNVYISHVFLLMETYQLWDHITDRVSTIYLPDKKRPMLPPILSEKLCSLVAGKHRVALVMSVRFNIQTRQQIAEPVFSNAIINVTKNYSYEDPKLNKNTTYCHLRDISGHTDSHDVVAWWMIKMNEESARRIRSGIFRKQVGAATEGGAPLTTDTVGSKVGSEASIPSAVPNAVRRWLKMDGPTGSAQYSTVSGEHAGLGVQHYVHITSPIRRIADIVNQAALMKDVMGYTVSADCERFLEKWLGKIDDLNAAMRNIRRVQMDCELLYHCRCDETAVDSIYSGMAIAKESDCEYTIYIEKLGLITYIKTETQVTLFEPMRFQIYVFNDEARLYKKVRIRCV